MSDIKLYKECRQEGEELSAGEKTDHFYRQRRYAGGREHGVPERRLRGSGKGPVNPRGKAGASGTEGKRLCAGNGGRRADGVL